MKRLAAAIVALSLPAAAFAQGPVAGPATCPAERAVYEMRAPEADEIWRLALVPARNIAASIALLRPVPKNPALMPTRKMPSIASDLYLKLTTPQRDYWFTFSVSQGYSGISVFPVTDPYAEGGPRDLLGPPFGENAQAENTADIATFLRFLSFDADLNVAFEPPRIGKEAPPFIMLPEIGLALWYDATALTGDAAAEYDPMPRGVFKRTQCLVAPHLEAGS